MIDLHLCPDEDRPVVADAAAPRSTHARKRPDTHTVRKKKFAVTITNGDRQLMKERRPGATLSEIDRFAVARAAGREAFLKAKCVSEALDCLTSGIPKDALRDWMVSRLKRPA